jgi:hypothetical protein
MFITETLLRRQDNDAILLDVENKLSGARHLAHALRLIGDNLVAHDRIAADCIGDLAFTITKRIEKAERRLEQYRREGGAA